MPAVVVDHDSSPVDTAPNTSAVAPFREGGKTKRDPKNNVNRPDPSRFTQQNLRMWEPMLTLNWSIGFCFCIAASCGALGVLITTESTALNNYRVVYDAGTEKSFGEAQTQQSDGIVSQLERCRLDKPSMANSFDAEHTCYVNITLRHTIEKEALLFYELAGYYQHHRRFVSSMDRMQFTDEWRPGMLQVSCAPMETVESTLCTVGTCPTSSTKVRTMFPCGMVANTMFNDIFWLHDGLLPNNTRLNRTHLILKGTARHYSSHNPRTPTWDMSLDSYLPVWKNPNFSRIIPPVTGDKQPYITSNYSNSTAWVHDPEDPENGAGTGLTNVHWRVWVETASRQPFRKPYGRIKGPLPAGTILVFAVQSNFYVRSFGGSKALVIGELSWFGSDNIPLGGFFLAVSAIFLIFTIFFTIRRCKNPRKPGDASALARKHRLKKQQ